MPPDVATHAYYVVVEFVGGPYDGDLSPVRLQHDGDRPPLHLALPYRDSAAAYVRCDPTSRTMLFILRPSLTDSFAVEHTRAMPQTAWPYRYMPPET